MRRLYKSAAVLALFALVFTTFPPPKQAYAALDNEPTRKVEIVIQSSKIDSTLTDFPVLLTEANIPSEACDADGTSPAQNGGGDIRFTSDENGNNQLPLEIVDFTTDNDPANCTVEMYVKVPSISATSDTSIWMWYNTASTDSQPAASSTYGSENVWDSNYLAVWHLGENPSGTSPQMADSSSNGYDLTSNGSMTSGDSVAAVIGNGIDFDGTDDWMDTGATPISSTDDVTFESWFYLKDADTRGGIIQRRNLGGNYGTMLGVANTNEMWTHNIDSNDLAVSAVGSFSTNSWEHWVGTFKASGNGDAEVFKNGVSQDTGSNASWSGSRDNTNHENLSIGRRDPGVVTDTKMDEVRVSTTIRSDAWIAASYDNQNDPATFAIEGSPQNGSTAPASSSAVKGSDENVTSSTTLQNDNDFTFTLKANTTYVIDSGIFATSTSGTPDIKIAFTAPSGSTMDIGYLAQGGSARRAELLETSGTASARIPIQASGNTIIQTFGSVVTGTSTGTLTLQWAQFQSNGNATTVKQGSFMTVNEVTN